MPKSMYKGRGRIIRYRTKRLNRKEYLVCGVVSRKGKHGGRTVCSVHKYKHLRELVNS